jgi:hypothetical protein
MIKVRRLVLLSGFITCGLALVVTKPAFAGTDPCASYDGHSCQWSCDGDAEDDCIGGGSANCLPDNQSTTLCPGDIGDNCDGFPYINDVELYCHYSWIDGGSP